MNRDDSLKKVGGERISHVNFLESGGDRPVGVGGREGGGRTKQGVKF